MPVSTKIRCPKCGEEFEVGEVLLAQIREEVLVEERKKQLEEIAKIREEVKKQAEERLKGDYEILIKQLREEAEEERQRNKKLLEQLENLSEQVRELRRKEEEAQLEMKKRLVEEEEKIREEVRKKVLEEHELKDKEKDEKLKAALKQVEELKAKIQQGSQQLQGEVLELELEEILRREFPTDEIEEVKKGQRGADVSQRVFDKKGRFCGTILWESKNAVWSEEWIGKLKDDQRAARAELAVLVVSQVPEWLTSFKYKDGVWVTTRKMVVPLAWALRFDLVRLTAEKMANTGREKKSEILYNYINSQEFRGRVEAIIESFVALQEEMERERRWFQTKWAREEKQLRKIIDHWQGMYGDLQGIVGKSLPEMGSLRLEANVSEEK
jgi:hypothetical protein